MVFQGPSYAVSHLIFKIILRSKYVHTHFTKRRLRCREVYNLLQVTEVFKILSTIARSEREFMHLMEVRSGSNH